MVSKRQDFIVHSMCSLLVRVLSPLCDLWRFWNPGILPALQFLLDSILRVTRAMETGMTNHVLGLGGGCWITAMSTQGNDGLNEGAIVILRLLSRHGELSIPAISGLIGLYESRVEVSCHELLKQELISRTAIPSAA